MLKNSALLDGRCRIMPLHMPLHMPPAKRNVVEAADFRCLKNYCSDVKIVRWLVSRG
jgi:hypothetical protein